MTPSPGDVAKLVEELHRLDFVLTSHGADDLGEIASRAATALESLSRDLADARAALERIDRTALKTGGHGAGKWHKVCLDIARSVLPRSRPPQMSDVGTKRAAPGPNKAALEAASEEAYNTAMSWRDPAGMAGMISWLGTHEDVRDRTRGATWAAIQTYNAMTAPSPSPEALPAAFSSDDVDLLNNEWWVAGYEAGKAAALAKPASEPAWIANCCHCGRIIDTREKSEGGDDWGHQLSDERWVCSPDCLDAVVEPASEPAGGGVREALAHCANEWADMATSGIQWLRNIRDGISTPDEALASMDACLVHCRKAADEVQAALSSPASSPAEWVKFGPSEDGIKAKAKRQARLVEAEALPAGVEAVLRDLVATLNVRGSLMAIDPDKLRAIVRKAEAALSSAPAPAPAGLGIVGISADIESKRVLKLHYKHEATDADRKNIVDAINALVEKRRAAHPAPATVEMGDGPSLGTRLNNAALTIRKLSALLRRYRDETPLGHQPHMIAAEVDAALAPATEGRKTSCASASEAEGA